MMFPEGSLTRRRVLALLGAGALAWLVPRSLPGREAWTWRDNDFDSPEAMARAHEPIMDLAGRVLASDPGDILDLGCGNGILVDRIAHANPGCSPWGVEIVAERAARARTICPEHADRFLAGDMFRVDDVWAHGRTYALVLLMPGRLLEAPPDQAERLRQRLRTQARNVLVYAYPDWIARAGTLRLLCDAAGLRTTAVDPAARVGLARVP